MKKKYILWLCVLLVGTIYGQTKSQKVRFANFSLVINNFYSECYTYNRFSEDNTKPLITVDSIFICETPCDSSGWYIDGQHINATSKSVKDSFEVSYAIEYEIQQGFDSRNGKFPTEGWDEWYKQYREWSYISKYKKLQQASNNYFRLPIRNNEASKNDLLAIKRKFGLRDTLIEITHEVGQEYLVFAKGSSLFSLQPGFLRLKIKRFKEGILKETKYVFVRFSEGCD